MRLKTLLLYRSRYLYTAIALTILLLVLNDFWYMTVLFPYIYFLWRKHTDLIKIIVAIFAVYILSVVVFNKISLKETDTYLVTVLNNIKVDTYTSFVGRIKHQKVKVYFDEDTEIKPGDILKISGNLEIPSMSTIPGTFDYKNYLSSQGIKYTVFAEDIFHQKSSFNIYLSPYYIEKYIEKHQPLSGEYIKTFILADKSDISLEVKDGINKIGISHLFAVSGLHIAMLVVSMEYFLSNLKLKRKVQENIIVALLLSYLMITSFSPSVTRATIMYVFIIVNKRYKLEFSSLDIISIIYILLLFLRPYYYFDAGFLLSFLVTFTILLSSNILNKKSKLSQLVLISSIAFLVTVPIILKLNYQINLLSILLNIFFLLYVTYLILPLSYIAFLFPIFDKFNYFAIKLFEATLVIVSKIDILIFEFYFPNPLSVIIYYVSLFTLLISLENNSRIAQNVFKLCLYVLIIFFSQNLVFTKSVSFIDIYGDSTLIRDSFNRCNILIDTGENDEYDSVIHYLKGKNIKQLDYLIISHFHSDHYGETNDVIKEFNVKNVISKNNVSEFENQLFDCGSISMFLYPFDYKEQNENNNSIVMSVFVSGRHYLFTGDIEQERESKFISEYNLNVDYIKVPHHGSITSSTKSFLESISPKEAFIIVSVNNLHGHPHGDVIKRYAEMSIPVHRTDLEGTIEVYYIFGKEYKRIHSP